MTKTGIFDDDPSMMAKASELKKVLQGLVSSIVDDEYYSTDAVDQAKETLSALKELKTKKRSFSLQSCNTLSCPDEFRCPLSREIMRDPVIVATGLTYDKPFIQKWLKSGNRTCPLTQQVMSHTILTPNILIREMISQWCKSRGIELSNPTVYINEDGVTESDRDLFTSLLEKMSSTVPEQKEAAKELRLLTKRMPSFRALFSESLDAIPRLLNPITESNSRSGIQLDLQKDVITTILNLSIHDNNKKLVAETPMAIPVLMQALRSGTIETKSNAAAALFTLSALDSNKALIGKCGALKPLIDLLDEAHPLTMKDVASAIFNLCIIHENKARAVRDGAVKVILNKITSRMRVDELLTILAVLSSNHKAVEDMGELGAVGSLRSIIRETDCARNKENCIAILHTICFYDRTKLKELREEEKGFGTISELARNGTSRAKRKAGSILDRLMKSANITHTT